MSTKQQSLFFLALSALLLSSCGGGEQVPAPTSYLKYSATLKGTSDVTIKPQISGQLMEVCITEGQQVKKGKVLFRIDSRNAQLELESAEANLLSAQASTYWITRRTNTNKQRLL